METEEIIEEVTTHAKADHVVITGGEPLIHEETTNLIDTLAGRGYHITVETNGTICPDAAIDLASISPKLSSSTPTASKDPKGDGEWNEEHEERRIDMTALARLVENYPFQLKFVVSSSADVEELNDIIEGIRQQTSVRVRNQDILLMPEGQTEAEIAQKRAVVADLAMDHGYRYTPRLHVNLWNDEAGR
jgi:7-carboxy-7-deazaguanine synthase